MNSGHIISIAVLSENQDDVALINSTLRDAGHAAHCHWVNQPKKLGDTLAEHNVELIIQSCDRYPESIRQVVKQRELFNPEIPVIALQDEADEAAIEFAMRSGASDLVSKRLRERLQSVVTRELRALRVERALNSTLQSATEYKRQLNDYMKGSQHAIAMVAEGIITDVNDAWLQMFRSASNDEVVGLPLMDNFEPESQAAVKGALVAAIKGKWKSEEKLVVMSRIGDGDNNELHLEFRRFDFDDGPSVQIRIAPRAKASEEPTKLVHDALKRDPATLFFHRAQFIERLSKRLCRKPASGLYALAYIKPDDFSQIIAKVGRLKSEEILAQFAEVIRKRLHPRDIAGRFEGKSIMVLLERGNSHDVLTWGRQITDLIGKRTFDIGDKSLSVTCTVGVCVANQMFQTLDDFIAAAVDAFAAGREDGGNTARLSEVADHDTKQREFDAIWVRHLKAALMDNRFRLAKLPIAGLRSDSVQMFDLLVRMLDEQGNSILPSEFLPAAERNNMMKNIDRWMISAAMDFCAETDADRVFVRMSRHSILDVSTVTWMDQEFDKRKFDCTRIVMQIPERDAAEHIKQTTDVVKQLRKMGIGFAIEHYGIDQDRFQILDMLKPDYIKIDGQLMHSLTTDSGLQASVEKIVSAANDRDIKTIAERVENANAMAVLFQLGLDYMQGHYVHEPEVVLQDTDSKPNNTLAALTAANAG